MLTILQRGRLMSIVFGIIALVLIVIFPFLLYSSVFFRGLILVSFHMAVPSTIAAPYSTPTPTPIQQWAARLGAQRLGKACSTNSRLRLRSHFFSQLHCNILAQA